MADEKPAGSSPPSPSRERFRAPRYGTGPEQPGGYPQIPALSEPPASVAGGRADDTTRVNGTSSGARPYESMPSLPLRQKPSENFPPPPAPPPSQVPSYPPAPPSMTEIPPQPTMSTAGSVVGGTPGAGTPGGGYGGYPTASYPPPPGGGYGWAPPPGSGPGPAGPAYGYGYGYDNGSNGTMTKADLRTARAATEAGLARLMDLQQQHRQHLQYGPGAANVPNSTAAAVQEQLRQQTGAVLRDLRAVRRAVSAMAKAAESHRFRRWLVGGILATFIPLVRRLFRRPARAAAAADAADGSGGVRIVASNDTEYAFARSRSLVDRMLATLRRHGRLASVACFVFAVLYIFSNEVSLRVARTVGRRLKKLSAKIERGDEELDEADLKQVAGWRWRVLLWGRQ